MLYFLATDYNRWNITEARQQLSHESEESNINRRLKTILQAIIDGQNFVKAAKDKARMLLKDLKDKSRHNTAEPSRTSNDTPNNTSNNISNNTSIVNNNYNSIVDNPIHITNNAPSAIIPAKRSSDVYPSTSKNPTQKRKPLLEYLEEGEGPVSIDDTTDNWIVNRINLSEKLHTFRTKSIEKVQQRNSPSTIYEELALNGIMFINEEGRKHYRISPTIFSDAETELMGQYPAITSSTNITQEIKRISSLLKVNSENAVDGASVWCHTAIQSNNSAEKKVARSLTTVLDNLAEKNITTMKEPLFCSQLVEPMVCPFLPQSSDVILKGSSEESLGSKARRGKEGRVPDLSLCVQVDGHNHALFLCEVKTISYMLQEGSHPDPDFIKLINIMKDELDNINNLASNHKIVYSLLVQGDMCRLFAMDFKYHKLYRLVLLDQFHLPINKYDTQRLDSCYHAMLRLESLLSNLVDEFTCSYYDSCPSTPVEGRLNTDSLKSFVSPHKN